MTDDQTLSTGQGFRQAIQQYAELNEWNVSELDDDGGVMQFESESGREFEVDMTHYDSSLEFWVASTLGLESEQDLPLEIAAAALRRNAELKIGHWCLADTEDGLYLGCMHDVELDWLNAERFANVVGALLEECDEFEGILDEWKADKDGHAAEE